MGKKFYNVDMQRLLKKHNINHYLMYFVMKASVVERFNHIKKQYVEDMFTLNRNYKWFNCHNLY